MDSKLVISTLKASLILSLSESATDPEDEPRAAENSANGAASANSKAATITLKKTLRLSYSTSLYISAEHHFGNLIV